MTTRRDFFGKATGALAGVAELHDGQQQEYYALRPDVVWLWAGLQRGHRGGLVVS